MLKYLIVPVIILVGLFLFKSAYCTTPGRHRVFETFNPLVILVFLGAFLVNWYFGYSFYQAGKMANPNLLLAETFQAGPFIILSLWAIPFLLASNEDWGFGTYLTSIIYAVCFFGINVSFLFSGGMFHIFFTLLMPLNGSIYPLAEELSKLTFHNDIFYNIFQYSAFGLIVVTIISLMIFLQSLFENTGRAIAVISVLILFSTGLIFPIALFSYIIGDLIWDSSPSVKKSSTNYSNNEISLSSSRKARKERKAARRRGETIFS